MYTHTTMLANIFSLLGKHFISFSFLLPYDFDCCHVLSLWSIKQRKKSSQTETAKLYYITLHNVCKLTPLRKWVWKWRKDKERREMCEVDKRKASRLAYTRVLNKEVSFLISSLPFIILLYLLSFQFAFGKRWPFACFFFIYFFVFFPTFHLVTYLVPFLDMLQ